MSSMTPTLPSTTTSSHSFAAHRHQHTLHDQVNQSAQPVAPSAPQVTASCDSAASGWNDPSSLSVNALDLWLEQATAAGPPKDNLNLNLDLLHNPNNPSNNPNNNNNNSNNSNNNIHNINNISNNNNNNTNNTFNETNHVITSTALSTPAITPSSHGRTPTYMNNQLNNYSPGADEGTTLADMIATQDPAALALEFSKPPANVPHIVNRPAPIPSTPSGSTNPLSSTPTPPAPSIRPQPMTSDIALHELKKELDIPSQLNIPVQMKVESNVNNNNPNMPNMKSSTAKTKFVKPKPKPRSNRNKSQESNDHQYSTSVASNSDSGTRSQSESAGRGPSSALSGAYMAASNGNSDRDDTTEALNALATRAASPSDGISAVERAKRSAEQFTISQLAKRRRKGSLPGSVGSHSSEDNGANGGAPEDNGPEAQSHRKYQKRLQKNRDSAFVSRIRRREYTRILENSLSNVEKEKDAALAAFREMKRRFDVVSAELAGIKTAAASNFGFRNPQINPVTIPDMPPGVFVPPVPVGFHPGRQPIYYRNKQQIGSGPQMVMNPTPSVNHSAPIPVQGSGRFMTTMYMVALVVGVLIPDFASRKTISTALNQAMGRGQMNVAGKTTERDMSHRRLLNSAPSLQGTSEYFTAPASDGTTDESGVPDQSRGTADRLIDGVRSDAIVRLGEEVAQRTLQSLTSHLRSLRAEEVNAIEQYSNEDSAHEGFEALLRAVLREDGDHAGEEDDLEAIIKQVSTLNFDDRL